MVDSCPPYKGKYEDSIMAVPAIGRLYALTSLQIGDVQSYVSRLFLLVAYEGLKLVFLVDNGPWTGNARRSRPAELWQLMVTKSRGSPFANRLRHYSMGDHGDHAVDTGHHRLLKREKTDIRLGAEKEKEDGWLSLLDALQRSCKERAQLKKPSHGLHGCVAFEVAWADVRGINYLNELQTDTCVGLEVRAMVKREFDSLEQAQACYATILSGSKDVGPSLSVAKILNGKNGSTVVRCSSLDTNVPGLVSEGSRAVRERVPSTVNLHQGAKNMEDSPTGRASGAGDKQVKKRQLEETSWPCESRAGAHVTGEYGRAYFNSLSSRFGKRPDLEQVTSSCSEYFTPPSSPFSGQPFQKQGHSQFKPFSSRQYKDSKKSRIWPVEVCEAEGRESLAEGRTSSEPVSTFGMEKSKTFVDRSQRSGVASKSFERNRSFERCSRCRLLREGSAMRGSQECSKCSGMPEVRQERVYVHPARLIAPAETYRDTLILFRFSEPLLPLELRRIITADQRLLKMLESGLPSWVIFMQSYPILCQLYRPWMRPLCGTIYYLISVVTVLIGFYDLYKNVPILKATAAHICGPLFEMIEEWGMVSRLKYLGTMLFLQNCEKAFEWAVAVIRAFRQISTLVMRPVLQPLIAFGETFMPVWEGVSIGVQTVLQLTSSTFSSVIVGVSSVISILVWPIVALFNSLWYLGMAVLYPMFSAIWTIFILPIQLVKFLGSLVSALSSEVMDGFRNIGSAIYNGVQVLIATGQPALQSFKAVKSSTPGPSLWRTLWNDIFSKVFHAVGSIVKGLLAFFTACNRHRLSIYNHVVDFLIQVSYMLKSGQYAASTACRQIFPLPELSKSGSAIFVDEVEPEMEMDDYTQYSREIPGLRTRYKGDTLSAPLLLIHSDSSSPQILKRSSCHFL
ncbi:hypothetical protein MPTK1_5g15500 [Marchantia polymorpha subsp. ruderalis]|uniref:Uncharacterized protein n=2 Tax=Marchantia polymorpha TaxID=3197 RepID=A0AAF6BIP3_MARPO|nr:hypothetical protein MARPO_0071s0059 [Marchantia polymorpha]BBN11877.1 hypothetical protein Mp_5g15500 [Marchantia polymorpha subsp. ruderalis]|eukprot:PTQ35443.1 hypothetical protein MARPO_0071s0059 [Marchantia polymorpha]